MPVQTSIRLRRGTAAQWTSTNPVLAAGEMGVETDTRKFKFGNGTSPWTSLAYGVGSVAAEGITIEWADITNKPATFPPSAHTHVKADITDFAHTHVKTDITDFAHTHVKTDITDFAHTHTISAITDYDRTAGTVLSDTAPVSPVAGLKWVKTTTMQQYIYFDSSWVEI
jgi:hypothetical protein